MSYSKGGRGKQAPYTTTHVRVPDPLKAEIENLISVWRTLVDSGNVSPTEAVDKMYKQLGYAQLNLIDAIHAATQILKEKKSANDSMIKLLTAIYDTELSKETLGRKKN
jgi:hypothetical protein